VQIIFYSVKFLLYNSLMVYVDA